MSEDQGEARPAEQTMKNELLASLDEVLGVLRAVANGELTRRLESRHPESHPVGALTVGVNGMIDALREARKESDRYVDQLNEQVATIERQYTAIQELSTPIIEVWTGVLCVPIIGMLDSVRASDTTRALLDAIVKKKAPGVIIDVTGIDTMDTRAADSFVRMARSVRLLGAKCILSGIHPTIARTIIQLGIDLSGVESYRTLRDALQRYVRSFGQQAPAGMGTR
jgi:rsbT co-antagonist protein RsbR